MKEVKDFPYYLVDEMGKVFSIDREIVLHRKDSPLPYKRKQRGRQIKTFVDKAGYERISLHKDGAVFKKLVHRLVAESYIPNPSNLPQVNHKDGDKSNNHKDNLEWVTASENMSHASQELGFRGESSGNSKLTEKDVLDIVHGHRLGYSQRELSRRYGVSKFCIYSILKGKSWGWLTCLKQS